MDPDSDLSVGSGQKSTGSLGLWLSPPSSVLPPLTKPNTSILEDVERFLILGSTLDDSPGEALDKIARRLQVRHPTLSYPKSEYFLYIKV